MNNDCRVIALTKRWRHHTKSGGYDRLALEIGAEKVVRRGARSKLWRHQIMRFWWRHRFEKHQQPRNYQYEDWLAERELLTMADRCPPDVVHALYADEQLDLLLRRRARLRCPLVATFHEPANKLIARFERMKREFVEGIQAAVVVSRYQLQDFQRWFGADRTIYVSHGIDTERFVPATIHPARTEIKLVTVGQYLRDFQSLRKIIDECNARRLPVEFELIIGRTFWPDFVGVANVRLRAGIEESDLIRCYQEADALLLPVADATANNAVLESLACGTPVISNAVGGMADYVNGDCGWLFEKGAVSGVVELIATFCRDQNLAASRRLAARRKALEFEWKHIARKMRAIYRAVADGRSPVTALET